MSKSKNTLKDVIEKSLTSDFEAWNTNLLNVGVDVVEVERIRRIVERTPSFASKMFSEQERSYCEHYPDSAPHYAARFAAKEAVVKALGSGFAQGVGYRDIEVTLNKFGKPAINLSGRASEIAESLNVTEIPISISHTHNEAVCCALAVTKDYIEAQKKSEKPSEIISASFKDLRKSLDEL